jgi:hypothetical protein
VKSSAISAKTVADEIIAAWAKLPPAARQELVEFIRREAEKSAANTRTLANASL